MSDIDLKAIEKDYALHLYKEEDIDGMIKHLKLRLKGRALASAHLRASRDVETIKTCKELINMHNNQILTILGIVK